MRAIDTFPSPFSTPSTPTAAASTGQAVAEPTTAVTGFPKPEPKSPTQHKIPMREYKQLVLDGVVRLDPFNRGGGRFKLNLQRVQKLIKNFDSLGVGNIALREVRDPLTGTTYYEVVAGNHKTSAVVGVPWAGIVGVDESKLDTMALLTIYTEQDGRDVRAMLDDSKNVSNEQKGESPWMAAYPIARYVFGEDGIASFPKNSVMLYLDMICALDDPNGPGKLTLTEFKKYRSAEHTYKLTGTPLYNQPDPISLLKDRVGTQKKGRAFVKLWKQLCEEVAAKTEKRFPEDVASMTKKGTANGPLIATFLDFVAKPEDRLMTKTLNIKYNATKILNVCLEKGGELWNVFASRDKNREKEARTEFARIFDKKKEDIGTI